MSGALVLDGHSRAAVETTQALGRAGVPVAVSAEKRNATAFASRYAAQKLDQPPAVPTGPFLDWLRELDLEFQFELIVPATETSLQALLVIPEDDSLRRRAVLASSRSIEIALDKHRSWELAEQLRVPLPKSRLISHVSEIGEATFFPTVLKPVKSKLIENGALKSFEPAIVADAAARGSILMEWVPRLSIIEQEYVTGWGVGVEMLYQNGKRVWYQAHERLHEWPLTGGASTYRRTIEASPEVLEAATRMLDALNWHGVAMVEFKRRADGTFAFMEINPRLWGSLALSIDAGVNFPLGLWNIATGKSLELQPRYRRGVRTRHLSKDLRWLRANIGANRENPLLLLRPRLSSLLELGLAFTGYEKWDHFDWRDWGPFLQDTTGTLRDALNGARQRKRIRAMESQHSQQRLRLRQRIDKAREKGKPEIVFICQANICRSPFAELVAWPLLQGCKVSSAALDSRSGRSTPPNVLQDAQRFSIDMTKHRSKALTAEIADKADILLVMEMKHYEQIAERFPDCLHRTFLLGLFAESPAAEIADPNYQSAPVVRQINDQIRRAITGLARECGEPVSVQETAEIETESYARTR